MRIARVVHVLWILIAHNAGATTVAEVLHPDDMCTADTVYGVTLLQVGRPVVSQSLAQQKEVASVNQTKASTRRNRNALHLLQSFYENVGNHVHSLGRYAKPAAASNVIGDPNSLMAKASCRTFALRLSLLMVFFISAVVAIIARRKICNDEFTAKVYVSAEDGENEDESHWVVSCDDLVSDMGLSGMCFLDLDHIGVSGWPLVYTMPFLALQGVTLQVIFLAYLLNSLEPDPTSGGFDTPLGLMIFAAVYVHFVNVMQELLFDLSKIVHIPQMHKKWSHQILVFIIAFVDCALVPGCTLVIGSLFLCTSSTAQDLIVNAVGVAFITNIDNFIVEINSTSNKMMRTNQSSEVHFPVDHFYVKGVNWLVCVVPIIPVAFSMIMFWSGKAHMNL